MQSDPEQRLSSPHKKRTSYWWAFFAVLALAVIVYLYTGAESPENKPIPAQLPTPSSTAVTNPQPTLPPARDIPQAPEAAPVIDVEETPAPPLTLELSDEELRQTLAGVSSSELLKAALANDNLIERSAGIIDGLSRGAVPYKALPIKPPQEKFSVLTSGEQTLMDPASYQRYDPYAQAISEIDTQTLAATFTRVRPLLEQAYAALGYPPQDLDNALIRTLDRIIATPQLKGDIELKRKETIYVYADPRLENLSEVQKLLLRTGPGNTALIQAQARDLRAALLQAP